MTQIRIHSVFQLLKRTQYKKTRIIGGGDKHIIDLKKKINIIYNNKNVIFLKNWFY